MTLKKISIDYCLQLHYRLLVIFPYSKEKTLVYLTKKQLRETLHTLLNSKMEKHYILRNILTHLTDSLKKQDFLVYFRKISIVSHDADKVVFGIISNFMKDNIKAKFSAQVLEATKKEFPNVTSIDFMVDQHIENPSNHDVIDGVKFLKEKDSKKSTKLSTSPEAMPEIKVQNERYTLANFIVGSDNQLAYSACEAVMKNPGKSYNPLYIY